MAAPFHGPRAGVRSANVTANTTLNSDDKVCQVLTPDSAWTVNITPVPRAGFGFMIRNAATVPGRTLALTDYADNAIVTLDAGEVYQVIGNGSAFIPFALSESTVVDLTLSDALTAAGDLINGTLTINHATATVEGIDLAVTQLTTARSSGEVVGHKVTLTGVATDSGGTYIGMDLNASDAGGSGTFIGIKMDAGWDAFADLSECATGEADIILGDNLAAAFVLREGSNNYLAIDLTNSTETVAFGNSTTNPVYSFLGSSAATFTGGLNTNTIAERTGASGVTIDGVLLKDSEVMNDRFVKVAIVATGAAGSNNGTLDVDVFRLDGTTAVASAKRLLIIAASATGGGTEALDATVTFSTATLGSIVATGNGYAEVLTDATGNFACTLVNSADDSTYVSAKSSNGVALATQGCVVVESVEDSATWSA